MAKTSATAISPAITMSLCRPPTPWAIISGVGSTSQVASPGSDPA